MLVNWFLCGILTKFAVFTNDPTDQEYKSRTDVRMNVITDSPWFNLPYPGMCNMICLIWFIMVFNI